MQVVDVSPGEPLRVHFDGICSHRTKVAWQGAKCAPCHLGFWPHLAASQPRAGPPCFILAWGLGNGRVAVSERVLLG